MEKTKVKWNTGFDCHYNRMWNEGMQTRFWINKQLVNSSERLVRILTLLNFSFPSITPKEASPKGFTLFQFVLLTLESFVYFSSAFPQSSTWCCTQCQELQGTHFGTQSSLFSLFPLHLYPPSLQKLAAVPLWDTVYSFKPTSHPKPQWVSPEHQLDHVQPPWSKPH